MGLSPHDFWFNWTFADYQRRAYYHIQNRNEEYKKSMEAARFIAMANNMIKNNKGGKFDKYLSFDWDKDQTGNKQVQPMTAEQARKITEFYNKMWSQNKNANSRN